MAGRGRRDHTDHAALRISSGTRRDMVAIDALYRSVGWAAPGGIRARDVYLLAHIGRELVGALMYWLEEPDLFAADDREAPYATSRRLLVSELAVAPHIQRSGVGRAVLHAAANAAFSERIDWIRTWPSPNGTETERAWRIDFFTGGGMRPWRTDSHTLEMVGDTREVLRATAPAH